MKSKDLIPTEARKTWKNSSCPRPVSIVTRICERNPNKSNRELVALCVAEGVSQSTASVYVSRFKSARKAK